jgi:hypothetical protein
MHVERGVTRIRPRTPGRCDRDVADHALTPGLRQGGRAGPGRHSPARPVFLLWRKTWRFGDAHGYPEHGCPCELCPVSLAGVAQCGTSLLRRFQCLGGPIFTRRRPARVPDAFRASGPMAILMLALATVIPSHAHAQGPSAGGDVVGVVVHGRVTDRTTEEPLEGVRVSFFGLGAPGAYEWTGESSERGGFMTSELPLGTYWVEVERIGFASVSDSLTIGEAGELDFDIGLVPSTISLEPILVAVHRRDRLVDLGFYERRRVGLGYFLTRQEIEERNALSVSDLFRRVPGARVVGNSPTSTAAVQLRGGCRPILVLDGHLLTRPVSLDDLLQVSHLEALEVYHGATAPVQYSRQGTCGTIILWTRTAQATEGSFSWRRVLVGGALGVGVILLAR